jgi:mercuric ion binding protein
MIRRTAAFLALSLPLFPLTALATEQTVTLDVHHAGCVLCGPIVRSTLQHVKGVKTVDVSQPNGEADVKAMVTFDDTQTGTDGLIKAATEHGYPADVAKPDAKS